MNKRFNSALIWNYISLIFMVISGLIMNFVIALYYDAEALGIFSETYAWYMVLSQLSVWGIHMSLVKFVPEKDDDFEKGSLLKTGLLISFVAALFITGISETVILLMGDFAWKKSMQIAFSGMILLSVNKLLLNYLNAIYRMEAYAAFTSLRYILFGGYIWFLAATGADPVYLATVFPLVEAVVLAASVIYFVSVLKLSGRIKRSEISKLFIFGTKFIPSYMVLEINTKVDVLCLGFLLKDTAQIGIYSFAIFFTEGFYMLYITIRKIINPGLSKAFSDGRIKEHLTELKHRLRNYIVFGGAAAYLAITAGYFLLCLILDRPEYRDGIVYFLIIGFAIMLNGAYIIFGDLLAQIGLPLEESALNVITVAGNFLINIILIVLFGATGAAVATAVSYCIFTLFMKWRIKKRLDFSI